MRPLRALHGRGAAAGDADRFVRRDGGGCHHAAARRLRPDPTVHQRLHHRRLRSAHARTQDPFFARGLTTHFSPPGAVNGYRATADEEGFLGRDGDGERCRGAEPASPTRQGKEPRSVHDRPSPNGEHGRGQGGSRNAEDLKTAKPQQRRQLSSVLAAGNALRDPLPSSARDPRKTFSRWKTSDCIAPYVGAWIAVLRATA